MLYLMAGATAPALGSYPYLMYGSSFAAKHLFIFWGSVLAINLLIGGLVVVMAYAVAFFGVSWPDRIVKSRLLKWILRGPVTASVTLGLMTVVRRSGELYGGISYSAFVPLTMVLSVLLMEHAITLLSPLWERTLFMGGDKEELFLLQNIEERLLTRSDLEQFLEAVLAAVRDHLRSPSATSSPCRKAAMNRSSVPQQPPTTFTPRAAIAAMSMISSTSAPRCSTWTGLFSPTRIGPTASASASR